MNLQYLLDELAKQNKQLIYLTKEHEAMKDHLLQVSKQMQELTQRLNCLSDKVTDQSTLIEKLVD